MEVILYIVVEYYEVILHCRVLAFKSMIVMLSLDVVKEGYFFTSVIM